MIMIGYIQNTALWLDDPVLNRLKWLRYHARSRTSCFTSNKAKRKILAAIKEREGAREVFLRKQRTSGRNAAGENSEA